MLKSLYMHRIYIVYNAIVTQSQRLYGIYSLSLNRTQCQTQSITQFVLICRVRANQVNVCVCVRALFAKVPARKHCNAAETH